MVNSFYYNKILYFGALVLILSLRTVFLIVHTPILPPNPYEFFIETLQLMQGTHHILHDAKLIIGTVNFS